MKRLLTFLTLGLLGMAALPADSAKAQNVTSTTFAQFTQIGGNKPFSFVNNNIDGAGQSLTGSATNVSVNFHFFASPFTQGTLAGNSVNASLSWTGAATADASGGPFIGQNFNAGTLQVVYTGPNTTVGGVNFVTGDVLLTVTYGSGTLFGLAGSSSPTFQASRPANVVTYAANSKYFNFGGATNENYSLGFSGLATPGSGGGTNPPFTQPPTNTAGFQVNTNNVMVRSFSADGSGTFAAGFIPEPASLAMVGLGLIGLPAVLAVRRRRAAR
jgi:hypothetical protein